MIKKEEGGKCTSYCSGPPPVRDGAEWIRWIFKA